MVSMSEYSWMLSLTSIILVFFTWNIVYRNAKRLATRAESKSTVDHVVKLLNELSDLSLSYWLGATKNKNSQMHTILAMSKINQINHYLEVLVSRGLSIDLNFIAEVHKATTLDCEKIKMLRPHELSKKGNESTAKCLSLMSHVFKQFELKYPPLKDETLEEWCDSLGPNQNY